MFIMNMYGYFSHPSHLEFLKLVQILKTKGNKIVENANTLGHNANLIISLNIGRSKGVGEGTV
jgi:hypothetical protein